MNMHRVYGLLLRHWYLTINSFDRMIDVVLWPVINLLLWGFAAVFVQKLGADKFVASVFLGGLLLFSIFNRAQKDMCVYLIEDFWNKSVYSLYVTPVTEAELFLSTAILGVMRAVIEFGIMSLCALAYGFNIYTVSGFAVFFVPLFIFAWAVGLFVNGIVFQYGARISIAIWGVPVVLEPFAAIYYPLSVLPQSLQTIAATMPLAYVFEGLRAAMNGVFMMREFFIALLLSIVYFIASYLLFRYMVKRGRRTGFLSKQ